MEAVSNEDSYMDLWMHDCKFRGYHKITNLSSLNSCSFVLSISNRVVAVFFSGNACLSAEDSSLGIACYFLLAHPEELAIDIVVILVGVGGGVAKSGWCARELHRGSVREGFTPNGVIQLYKEFP